MTKQRRLKKKICKLMKFHKVTALAVHKSPRFCKAQFYAWDAEWNGYDVLVQYNRYENTVLLVGGNKDTLYHFPQKN